MHVARGAIRANHESGRHAQHAPAPGQAGSFPGIDLHHLDTGRPACRARRRSCGRWNVLQVTHCGVVKYRMAGRPGSNRRSPGSFWDLTLARPARANTTELANRKTSQPAEDQTGRF